MAQVIDTMGKQRDTSRKANGLPQVVSGSSHGGNKTEVKPDLKPEVEQQQQQQSQRQYSSSPFSRAVRRYTGISGGTPTTSEAKQPSQQWSPIYASLSDDGTTGQERPESYWGNMREREGKEAPEDTGSSEQQSEESSGLMPEVRTGPAFGNHSWNDVYEKDMLAQGMSQDYIDKVIKDPYALSTAVTEELENGSKPEWSYDEYSLDDSHIDDGTMDKSHLLSDWMTGKQYYHYVHDLGMPGMPEDEIDVSDNGKYAKTQQRQIYGFPQYIPNSSYELGLTIPNIMSAARTFSDYIGNLRTHGFADDVDYMVNTDTGHGAVNSFSGRDFERKLNGYTSQTKDLHDRAVEGDPEAMSVFMSDENHSSPYTTMVREWTLPDGSKHYGVNTEKYKYNDLVDEDTYNDLVWWGVDEDTVPSPPDENGMMTYGNMTINPDGFGTLQTKDGFTLNVEPTSDGRIQVADDDAYEKWWDSHSNGDVYLAFSDGSSAIVSAEDIKKANKEHPNQSWLEDELVSYDTTNLKDMEGFDPTSLTVGNPTSLGESLDENGNGSEVGMMYVPDMVLPDGTPISQDVVFKVANDKDPDDWRDDGISYDFERGVFGLPPVLSAAAMMVNPMLAGIDSRPRHLMHDNILDEDGLHLGLHETPDWITDAGLNSIPISTPVYQWVDAGSRAYPYIAGIESASGDEYGRYQTTGYDPGSEENAIKAVSTLFSPALENLAGYGHEPLLDPMVERLIGRTFDEGTFPNLLLSKGWDSVGEAAEEVFGNYVDEPSVYGFRNSWASPIDYPYAGMGKIYDKDHNQIYEIGDDASDKELSAFYDRMVKKYGQFPVLYDEHGREFRDPNTPIGDRLSNAFAPTPENLRDTANSAFGGAGVSMLYSMPELMMHGFGSGIGSMLGKPKPKNSNLSQGEWEIGADVDDIDDEIHVPDSVKSDRISTNDYRISPGAPIRFKE